MDFNEATSFEMTEEEFFLACTLRRYIDSNDINNARFLIQNVWPVTRYRLTRPNKYPFLPAALYLAIIGGNVELVKLLINDCGANFHEKIWVGCWSWLYDHDGKPITDKKWMSPLEMSIWRSTPDIFEYLVSIGADVYSLTKDSETIVRACWSRSIKTVQILLDHGADVNASNEKGRTCLMAATCMYYVDLCRFLLDRGAEIDKADWEGNTALHRAAISNFVSTVKLFVERGADAFFKNNHGFDALHTACRYSSVETVDFLIETVVTDVKRKIEALQFLGIRLHKERRKEKTVQIWRRAIELSSECGIATSATRLLMPCGVADEATTLAELDELSRDGEKLYIQCVLLAHKMFGPTHNEFFDAIGDGMDYYIRAESYECLMHQVIYCFKMIQNSNLDPQRRCLALKSFHETIEFSILDFDASANFYLNFDLVYDYTRRVVEKSIIYTNIEEAEILMKLVVDGALLFTYTKCDKRQKMDFHNLMRSAIRTSKGRTLMIIALKWYECRYFQPHYSSHLEVITMLLECGADVNERDDGGNNVLHILMAACMESRPNIRYRVQLLPTHEIVKTLALKFVENGIHLDARNHQGLDATSFLKKAGINVVPPINLMCSAARAIRRFKIPVEGVLPKILVDFVEMH